MTQQNLMELLKIDLGIIGTAYDAQLTQLLSGAGAGLYHTRGRNLDRQRRGYAAHHPVRCVPIPQAGDRRGDAAHVALGAQQPYFLGRWRGCSLIAAL